MTNKSTFFIIIIIAIIVWLLLPNEQDKIISTYSVSQQTVNTSDVFPKKPKLKEKTVQTEADFQTANITSQPITNKLKELSYIQLYEKSLVAIDCLGFYILDELEKKQIDYLQVYKDNIGNHSNGRQQQATDKQIEAYQSYVNECLALKNEVESYSDASDEEKDSFTFTVEHIRSVMKNIKPMTDEGRQIKLALKEKNNFNKTISNLKKLNSGKSDLSEQQTDELESEIRSLKRELYSGEFFRPEAKLTPKYLALKKEYDDKYAFLKSHLIVDDLELNRQKDIFYNSMIKLQSQLTTKYPSVFREVFNSLNLNKSSDNRLPNFYILDSIKKTGVEVSVISQQIFEQSAIKDKAYFNHLLQPSLDLYQCFLGEDCTFPNNRQLSRLCYMPGNYFQGSSTGLFFEACELSLEDFYLQNYLTDNQVEDMNEIFNYLVNN